MDIFEEVKEAVMAATPGEDTRNYYRNQGIKIEQERIIKLLEAEQLHDPDVLECHCGSWREAIALIKGEK